MLRLLSLAAFLSACGCGGSPPPAAPSAAAKASPRSPDARAALLTQARQIADFAIAGDMNKAADMALPALVTAAGGRHSYIRIAENGINAMRQEGFTVTGIEVGEASELAEAPSGLYAVVRYTARLSEVGVKGEVKTTRAYFLAASQDGGVTWKFADGAGLRKDPKLIKRLIPDFPASLTLPTQ